MNAALAIRRDATDHGCKNAAIATVIRIMTGAMTQTARPAGSFA